MSKKNSPQTGSRSFLGTILALIVVIIAAIVSFFGGGLDTPTPDPVVTTAPGGTAIVDLPDSLVTISIPQGFGAQYGFWQVYFSAPTGSSSGPFTPIASNTASAKISRQCCAFERACHASIHTRS